MLKGLILIALVGLSGCVGPHHYLKDRDCIEDAKGSYYYKAGYASAARTPTEQERYTECKKKMQRAESQRSTHNTVAGVVGGTILIGSVVGLVAGAVALSANGGGGGGGGGGGCNKCKKTIVRSDGVTQSYWVCC